MEATGQVIFCSSYLGCGFVFSSIAETFGSIASAVLIPYALDTSVALVGIEKVYMVVLESVVHDTDDYAFAGVGTVILCHLVTVVYTQQFAGVVHQQFGLSTYRNRNNLIEIGNRFDGRQGHVGSDKCLADARVHFGSQSLYFGNGILRLDGDECADSLWGSICSLGFLLCCSCFVKHHACAWRQLLRKAETADKQE